MPGQPIGQVLPSEQPRLSMAGQLPARGGRGHLAVNVPIILGIRSVAPALTLGNAVLLKPDPRTAVTGGTVMARIFEEAGLPARLCGAATNIEEPTETRWITMRGEPASYPF